MNTRKKKVNHMKERSPEIGQRFDVDSILLSAYEPELMQEPSPGMIKQARATIFGSIESTDDAFQYTRSLTQKYPELDWRDNKKISVGIACWYELDVERRREIIKNIGVENSAFNDDFRVIKNSLNNLSFVQNEATKKGIQVYKFLKELMVQDVGTANRQLLSDLSFKAACEGKLMAWRFMCLPEVDLDVNTLEWQAVFGTARYDTFTPSLDRDAQFLEGMRNLGIEVKLKIVLDDWEAPYLRSASVFYKLSPEDQVTAIDNLKRLRSSIDQWVSKNSINGVPVQTLYISALVGFKEFVDLIDAQTLEMDPKYIGILSEEMRFVRESSGNVSEYECQGKASRRIAQYAAEGSIIASSDLGSGIYLNSEYPTKQVWKKLTLLAQLPTLFYVADSEVRNI